MSLDTTKWNEFRFGDLISNIYKAKAINKDDLSVAVDNSFSIRYITRTGENNGCELLADVRDIEDDLIEKGNAITIGDTTATCFYQDEDFITGDHMVVVRADSWLNPYTGLYIVAILKKEQYKYSYGRAYLKDKIADTIIKLPIDSKGKPDWQYMEKYMKSLHYKPLTTTNGQNRQVFSLDVQKWKAFRVGSLFDIHPTKAIDGLTPDDCVGYGYPLVVNSAENNGIAGLCNYQPTEKGNIITFSDTTDGNTFFYQPNPFIGFAHVQGMYPKNKSINGNALLFISAMLMFDSRGRYSYGRKMRRDTISEIMLKLPVDSVGNPDWQFMDNYMKSLPYGDRLAGSNYAST